MAGYLPAAHIGHASDDRAGVSGGESQEQELEAEKHTASPTIPLVNEAATNFCAGPKVAHAAPPCGRGESPVLGRGNNRKSD